MAFRPSTWFPALREAPIRRYMMGQTVSVFGLWVQLTTLNLLAWELTHSPSLLGLLNFLLFAPAILVSPWLGPRMTAKNAKPMTQGVLLGTTLMTGVLMVLQHLGLLTTPWMIGVCTLLGVLNGIEMPARQVLLSSNIRNTQLIGSAVALNTALFNLARMLAPALAAWLFVRTSPNWGFGVGLAAFVFMVLMVGTLPSRERAASEEAPEGTLLNSNNAPAVSATLGQAFDYARADPLARLFLPIVLAMALTAGAYQPLVPVVAARVFGNAAEFTGVLFGAAGGGALVAALLLATQAGSAALRYGQIPVPWGCVLALCLVGFTPYLALHVLGFFMVGFALTFTGPGTNAQLQQNAPVHLRGALIGLYIMCFAGAVPFGYLLAGQLAQWLGVQATLGVLAALLWVALAMLCLPRWRKLGRVSWDTQAMMKQ